MAENPTASGIFFALGNGLGKKKQIYDLLWRVELGSRSTGLNDRHHPVAADMWPDDWVSSMVGQPDRHGDGRNQRELMAQ